MNKSFFIGVPIKPLKTNEHWTKTSKRNKLMKLLIGHAWEDHEINAPLPCTVKLVRVSPRKFDEDNLMTTFKGIRDRVADKLIPGLAAGRADGDPRITWVYEQRKPVAKEKGFIVEVSW